MASRTRPATTSMLSPPPSPQQQTTTTSKYHVRRKSGHRPTLSRRQTSKSSTKINKLSLPTSEPSEQRFQYEDEDEAFFNFCTTCDKQLPPSSGNYLYCSEACRHADTISTSTLQYPASPPLTPFGFGLGGKGGMTFPQLHERHSPSNIYERSPRLIPTQYLSPSPHGSHSHERKTSRDSVSALDSLRSLSRALDASTSPRELEHETPGQDSSEEEDSEDDDDEEPETYRRLSGTPHPGNAVYGTYIHERINTPESRPSYTSGRHLP